MRNRLARLAKEPLVQFLLIGACIYGAYALFGAPDEEASDRTVLVDANRIEGFRSAWQQRWNRPPTRKELDGLIQQYVREDIYYREAVTMGLDKDDPITRRRMARKLEFLTDDIARLKEPAAGELEQFFVDNKEQYQAPDRITFSHVFLDSDKRKETTFDDAAELLAQLQAAGEPNEATLDAGDRFILQRYYPKKSELDIQRQFGSGFSAAVMRLEPGRWYGPVPSGYGAHLVYVHDLQRAPPPVYADVRQSVLENWQADQQGQFNEAFFESLKNRYDIVIEEPPFVSDSGRQVDTGSEKNTTPGEDESIATSDPAS